MYLLVTVKQPTYLITYQNCFTITLNPVVPFIISLFYRSWYNQGILLWYYGYVVLSYLLKIMS